MTASKRHLGLSAAILAGCLLAAFPFTERAAENPAWRLSRTRTVRAVRGDCDADHCDAGLHAWELNIEPLAASARQGTGHAPSPAILPDGAAPLPRLADVILAYVPSSPAPQRQHGGTHRGRGPPASESNG